MLFYWSECSIIGINEVLLKKNYGINVVLCLCICQIYSYSLVLFVSFSFSTNVELGFFCWRYVCTFISFVLGLVAPSAMHVQPNVLVEHQDSDQNVRQQCGFSVQCRLHTLRAFSRNILNLYRINFISWSVGWSVNNRICLKTICSVCVIWLNMVM